MARKEKVSVVLCPSNVDDETVVQRTEAAIMQSCEDGKRLATARKIAVKINAGINRVVLTEGRQTELTEPAVVEGAIRAIRAVTDAEIVIGDAPTDRTAEELYHRLGLPERLSRYANIRLLDFAHGELVDVDMAHEGAMFRQYTIHREIAESDACVSLAKMKAHRGTGCTLCMKNLFGWMPPSVYGHPRLYLHDRLIRLSRVLADMALWMRPCLNVVDGIVAANKSEWHGEALHPGVILAGSNIVATDSVGARIMGFDPEGDYPDHPFFYRRNYIKLAAEAGLGPNNLDEIEIVGPSPEEVGVGFEVHPYSGATHRDEQIRRGAACVAAYLEQQEDLAKRYRGRYLAMYDGEVLWDGPDVDTMRRLERESGRTWQNAPQFVIRSRFPDEEIERMEWYGVEAARLNGSVQDA